MADAHDTALQKVTDMFKEPEAEPETEPEVPEETAQGEPEVEAQAEDKPAQPEEVEVEIDGETYLVPKKISDRFIQHADYTRKTMDLAEMRRALSAEREAQAMEKAFTQATSQEREELATLDYQLKQFKQIDWSKIEDTAQLVHLKAQMDNLRERRSEVDASLKGRRAEFEDKVKSMTQEAMASGQKVIAQRIGDFTDTRKQELFAYGLNEGYTRDELDRIVDPRLVVTLWKASQWDALQASKPTVTARATRAAPVVKPGPTRPQPSRVQLSKAAIKDGKTNSQKVRAAEAYFASILGE